MAETSPKIRLKDFGFYIVVFFIAVAVWESQKYMYSAGEKEFILSSGGIVEVLSQCNDVQKQQIDAYLEINRLLTTLGTTLLGATFYLLSSRSETFAWKRRMWAALAGMIFVAISLFFGYVAYSFIISILQDGRCDVSTSYPHWAQQTHFYTFFLGVVFFADFIYSNLTQEDAHEK